MEIRKRHARAEKTDGKILISMISKIKKNSDTLSIKITEIVQASKISKSTFYRHAKNPDEFILKEKNKIFSKYKILMRTHLGKTPNQFFRYFLIFLKNNPDFFEYIFSRNDRKFVFKMMKIFENRILNFYHFPKNSKKIFEVYYSEIYGILDGWAKDKFDEKELEEILKEILYLSQNARRHLMPLVK